MKQISDQLSSRLSGEVLSLCLCWTLTRTDGVQVWLTDHDDAVSFDGARFEPGAALDGGLFTHRDQLKPGMAAASGVLSSAAITEEALLAGLWDACWVDVHQLDWQAPEAGRRHVWSGLLGEIQISQTGVFEFELVGLKAELERPVGRLVQRRCDARLGDARCGLPADAGTCDQRFETCRDVFANSENFRGFPHLPGNDFILSGPAESGNDGGQR